MEETTGPTLGALLKMLRCLAGWTQGELARAAGTRQSAVSEYENESGAKRLTRERLESLAAAMGLGAETIDLSLAWSRALRPGAEPVESSLDPTPEAQRRIHKLVLILLNAAVEPTRESLVQA
ncbi:MAG: helix-turn-helix domain-containing protein, partial [Acidobacteriota bacterium]|nr:helix-turn-helix domain-containing protein [Acidobacteriota bacterium]